MNPADSSCFYDSSPQPPQLGNVTTLAHAPRPIQLLLPPEVRPRAKRLGAHYSRSAKTWTHPGPLPRPLIPYAPEPHTPAYFDLVTSPGITPPPDRFLSGPDAVTLRPHQREASNLIVRAHRAGLPGFLLADEVGLGKTYSTLDAIARLGARRSTNPLKVLILAPLSVTPHWRRSIDTYPTPGVHFCVSNYEQAKNFLFQPAAAKEAKRTRTKNKRWAAKGRSRVNWDIVVCDESHRLKNLSAQRSAAVRQIISTNRSGKRSTPAFTIWVSATAGQNPLELAYLAPLLATRHGQSLRELSDFEAWCSSTGLGVRRGPFGSWVWDENPADLETMRSILFSPFRPKGAPAATRVTAALRRRPTDISGWPELVRAATPVALSPGASAAYATAWDEFCEEMAAVLSDPDALADLRSDRSAPDPTRANNPLVAALRFRQKASILRSPATAQMITDMLTDGLRPAVSVQFYDSTDAILSALPSSLRAGVINGSVPPSEREEVRRAFQRGDLDTVLFSPTEGISLHAGETSVGGDLTPRTLLIHDIRWSALEMAQIEGRTHRDGQAAVAHYLYAAGTVEERVVAAVTAKLSNMAEMLGDDTTGLDALLAALG